MLPAIADGSGEVTRLSVMAEAEGCWKLTLWLLPTLKLFQSIAARGLLCSIVVAAALRLIWAAPPTTTPPCGRAFGAGCDTAGAASTTRNAVCNAVAPSSPARSRRTSPRNFRPPCPLVLAMPFPPETIAFCDR